MEYNTSLFSQLSRNDRKAALEAVIFSSDEPVSISFLIKTLFAEPIQESASIVGEIKSDFRNETTTNILKAMNNNEEEHFSDNSFEVESELEFHNYQPEEMANQKIINFEKQPTSKNLPGSTSNIEIIEDLIQNINLELAATNRPFRIINIAGGYQYAVRPEYGELMSRLIKSRTKRRFSQAALESLAIIAYRQPVTKPEVEQIRGVNSGDVINSLVEKNIIVSVGRKDSLGKPLLYGTTIEFLKMFGLNSLDELPKLREIEDFADDDDTNALPHFEITVDEKMEYLEHD